MLLDGRELASLRLKDIRKEIGLVAQNTELFAGSVEENISYGMEAGTYTRYAVFVGVKELLNRIIRLQGGYHCSC